MAQRGFQPDTMSCSMCLDLLKDPVTTSCGHSYCTNCIKSHWDKEDEKKLYSCPLCSKMFTTRPVLDKNTLLAVLVEEMKKTGLQAAPADHCYAGPEDVACDVCTGRKLRAIKSCLVCLVSYCEKHLQPHFDGAPFRKHKLVEPSKNLQENICSHHGEVMKMFCRTDQQSICYPCSMEDHKGHDMVSAAAERTERQRELEVSRLNVMQRIKDRQRDVKVLQQEVEAINGSIDKAVEETEKIFSEWIRQVRSKQQTEASRVRELQEKLEQEIAELKRKDAEMEQLSHTEDHNQFLHNYPSVSALGEATHPSSISIPPLRDKGDVTSSLPSQLRDHLKDVRGTGWTNASQTVPGDVSLLGPEPKTRAEFISYSRQITMDPNTANAHLRLSDGDRKAIRMKNPEPYPSHPDRFQLRPQVLSRESLTGRCYWEVEFKGPLIYVAVSYKSISRDDSLFGQNGKSWMLRQDTNGYNFVSSGVFTPVSGPPCSRIGVYLDHTAGVLSFYSVSETMTLLHRVQIAFTEPLYAGLYVGFLSTAQFCRPK